jgi:hypothetical protein
MKKIISLFQRNYDGDRLVRDEVVPGAEWVINGEGEATIKWDGTCCLVRDGKLYKRYDAKRGKEPPGGFEPAQDPDPVTGHWPGWILVSENKPDDQWHIEAWKLNDGRLRNGTYELVGPKINGNNENFDGHQLIPHGHDYLFDCPRTFNALKDYLRDKNIEGVVWHHADGRMVKIKKKDFGLKRSEEIARLSK